MPAKFVLKKGSTGKFRFNLLAPNGQVIAASETYETKRAAQAGIDSVKKNAAGAAVDDQTAPAKTPATRPGGGVTAKKTTGARKAAAKKTAGAKKTASAARKTTAKKTATKKTTAKKTSAAKKTTAKRTSARKTAAKKAAG